MNLFKRIEFIALLVLAVGGAAFVLLGHKPGGDSAPTSIDESPAGSPAPAGESKIHRCTLERDYGNARLDIELRFSNRDTKRLVMQPPNVKLVTDSGREVPPFFLPIEPPPEIPANSTQDVRLRYWLEKADLGHGLALKIKGERIEVKTTAPFDLEKLKDKEPKVFTGTNWNP